jgi:hypothetical protein
MVEEKSELLSLILKRYEQINGRKILENLKKYEFSDDERFASACLKKAFEYLEKKGGELTDEEFLALLIRLTMMYFVEVKRYSNLWYSILSALLPEEIQTAKMSEVVRKFEEQFIEHMETIAQIDGDEGIRNAVLVFLFKENAEFTLSVLKAIEGKVDSISKIKRRWNDG